MKQLTYSYWNQRGRLGNMCFQLASLHGMGKRYNREVVLPDRWHYQPYFKQEIKIIGAIPHRMDIDEPFFHHSWVHWDEEIGKRRKRDELVSVCGWLQSSQYWEHCVGDIKNLFEFKDAFLNRVHEKWDDVLKKPCICMGVRVGWDYRDNGNYEILPISYQLRALEKYFPNQLEENNIIVFADDFDWAKRHIKKKDNIFFAEMEDIDQLCLGSMCTHFIIPNSTFSWWQAYLGEKSGSVIIRPDKYFKGYLARTTNIKDFWERRWKSFSAY